MHLSLFDIFIICFVAGGAIDFVLELFGRGLNVIKGLGDRNRKINKVKSERDKAIGEAKYANRVLDRMAVGRGTLVRDAVEAHKLAELLQQVIVADDAYPQLPIDLRARIETALKSREEAPVEERKSKHG